MCSVMIGVSERRQERQDSQQASKGTQKQAIPLAERVEESSVESEQREEEQGSTKRPKASEDMDERRLWIGLATQFIPRGAET